LSRVKRAGRRLNIDLWILFRDTKGKRERKRQRAELVVNSLKIDEVSEHPWEGGEEEGKENFRLASYCTTP